MGAAQTWTIYNTTGASVPYTTSIVYGAGWTTGVTLSPSSGTIAPGSSATINVSTSRGALADGTYTATVSALAPGVGGSPVVLGVTEVISSFIFKDTFTRADNASGLGSPDVGSAWTAGSGTLGIQSNKLYFVSNASGDYALNSTVTVLDGTIHFSYDGATQDLATNNLRVPFVIFRGVDGANYLSFIAYNGNAILRKTVSGSNSNLNVGAITTTGGTTISIVIALAGNSITVTNASGGATVASATLAGGDSTTFNAAGSSTKLGVGLVTNASPVLQAHVTNLDFQ